MKSPFMVAFLPGAALVFIFSLLVDALFPTLYLTLYNLDGLFNEELNVSWLYPLLMLGSTLLYMLTGFIYTQLVYARYVDQAAVTPIEEEENILMPPAPLTGSIVTSISVALVGTLATFPWWLYRVLENQRLFVILYDDGLNSLGYYGILMAGIIRHWGANLVLGTLFGAVFGALGSLVVKMPPLPEPEENAYEYS